jgi:hypothetical protein
MPTSYQTSAGFFTLGARHYRQVWVSAFPFFLVSAVAFLLPYTLVEVWADALPATSPEAFSAKLALIGMQGVWIYFELLFAHYFLGRHWRLLADRLSLAGFFHRHALQCLLELIRMSAWTLINYLLLIVPGIVRQAQYGLVPTIVLFDESYDRGDVDALVGSRRMVRGFLWMFIAVLGLLTLVSGAGSLIAYDDLSMLPRWGLNLLATGLIFSFNLFCYNFYCQFYMVHHTSLQEPAR